MELRLCGTVQLFSSEQADSAIALPAKSLALLTFLLLAPGAHGRSELGALLWGDADEKKSSASLRQALKQLRDAVGDVINTDGPTVFLARPLASDVERFRALAREGSTDALLVEIPRVFSGLIVRDAPLYSEWLDRTKSELLREYRLAIAAAARVAHKRRDWPTALDLARRWQNADPLSDEAAHLLIEVLFLMGERDTALASYREYVALRRSENVSPPGLAVRELAKRIEHASAQASPLHVTPARSRSVASSPMPAFAAPLVGRDTEWDALQRAWETVADAQSTVVVLDGEAGMGKSRLLDEFVHFVLVSGAAVLRTRAFESSADLPFGPVLDLVRAAISAPGAVGTDGQWLSELARVVPDVRREFPSVAESAITAPGASPLFAEAIAQLLLAVTEEVPVLVVVDDVQWCDGDSCHVLQFLVHRLANAPVLWCIARTSGLAARDSASARLVRALRTAPSHQHIVIEPLSADAVWQLIRKMGRITHPDGARRFAARVYEVTGGNPLYVIELLKTLFARGWIRVHHDTQEWIPGDNNSGDLLAHELFPDAQAAIAERVAALPDEQHAVLLTVATLGGPCHTSLLSYVHGISRLRAAHLCDGLVERRLLTESDGFYLCAHAVIGEAVLSSMGTSRRREVHRMIALALTDAAASVNRTVDPGAIARHAAAGGETAMAFRSALHASALCAERAAWEDAMSWADLASQCADTAEAVRLADEHTAQLLARAGWSTPPARTSARSPTPQHVVAIDRADVDLG